MRARELRHVEATLGETGHNRKGREFDFEKMRSYDLACDADIRKSYLRPEREWCRPAPRQQPLIGRKPFASPVLAPILDRFCVSAKSLGQMIANARHHEGMRIGDRHQRQ